MRHSASAVGCSFLQRYVVLGSLGSYTKVDRIRPRDRRNPLLLLDWFFALVISLLTAPGLFDFLTEGFDGIGRATG
jgi:hypothetical protein